MTRLKKAERKKSKLRLGLFGPSGSGKTYSALLLARGLAEWDKIAVIDTERGSANLYDKFGPYNVLALDPPYAPERYIDALRECEAAGMDVIIVDSITHEWEGPGGCLEIHSRMTGQNSYTNWKEVTPRHNRFVDAILNSPAHVICCSRTKTDYQLVENDRGKMTPQKIGLKAVTREGFDYEMTICFDLDIRHNANTSKDRSGLFMDAPSFVIASETGERILDWLNHGADVDPFEEIRSKIRLACVEKHLSGPALEAVIGFSSPEGKTVQELEEAYLKLIS